METDGDQLGRSALGPLGAGREFRTSCLFCQTVLQLYPSLEGLSQRDELIFRAHLKCTHGLTPGVRR